MSALARHRGPFQFQLTRLVTGKPLPVAIELLKGTVDRENVMSEARALLTDPRDTITSIAVWSVVEQQHIGTVTADNMDSDL